jgi:hypothetical protein
MRIRQEEPGTRQIEFMAGPGFNSQEIKRISISPKAEAVILIDDVPYCGFGTIAEAEDFIDLICGNVDGSSRRVTKHHGVHWPAIKGKEVKAVRQ